MGRVIHIHLHDAPESVRAISELKRIHDLDAVLESPKGSLRRGKGWEVEMPYDYGYVMRTVGADGEQEDLMIGPNPESEEVFMIEQLRLSDGAFDERKWCVGYRTPMSALEDYVAGFSDGRGAERIGAMRAMKMAEFKEWLSGRSAQAF